MTGPAATDRISVCVCTFRRPDLLARLLRALELQEQSPVFSFDVVVVDNDHERSAQETVRRFQSHPQIEIIYDWEPEQNISLTRNRAVRNTTGNLVAFIDDDEAPAPDWLVRLHRTLERHDEADGVLGPVLPEFPEGAPDWLRKGRFFKRRRLRTGTRISAADARTGNLLMRRSTFVTRGMWFDAGFGRTGGEDSDFFEREFRQDRSYIWCDEAVAYEWIPSDRWRVSFHVKRHLRSGTLDGERLRAGKGASTGVLARSALILCACAAVAPFSLLMPRHLSTRVLQKLAYCGGILSAYCGVSLLRNRE